jgi:type I restriction enzyme S subunit
LGNSIICSTFASIIKTNTYGIRDGRSISFSEFAEMNFYFPSKEEQTKIALYFHSLDKQISLQEARLEKLKQIKAACLDKMFV